MKDKLREYLAAVNTLNVSTETSDFRIHSKLADFVRSALDSKQECLSASKSHIALSILIGQFYQHVGCESLLTREAMIRLKAGAPVIRINHQPNTLTSLNVVGLALAADAAREEINRQSGVNPVCVWFLLDYDSASDQRFRSFCLPGWSKPSIVPNPSAVSRRLRHQIACAVPPPDEETIARWIVNFRSACRAWFRLKRGASTDFRSSSMAFDDRIDQRCKALQDAMRRHQTLVAANSALLSQMINHELHLDTLFVLSTSCIPAIFQDIHHYSLKSAQDSLPSEVSNFIPDQWFKKYSARKVWRVCPQCISRAPSTINPGENSIEWRCAHCDQHGVEGWEYCKYVSLHNTDIPAIVPAVGLCDRLDVLSIGARMGINYAGGIEHLLCSRLGLKSIGAGRILEFSWEPSSVLREELDLLCSAPFLAASEEVRNCWRRGRLPAAFYLTGVGTENLRRSVLTDLGV